MEVDQQVLHMNGGVGKTSYATNSLLQRAAISMVKPIKASIEQLCSKLSSDCLKIADFGWDALPDPTPFWWYQISYTTSMPLPKTEPSISFTPSLLE
ncbi:hypothetical protein ACFX12_004472 [Malus domestica]